MSSYTPSYMNGTNANGTYSGLRRFDFSHDSSRDTSADERSRSRPAPTNPHTNRYNNSSQYPQEQVQGVSRLERGYANRRSRDYGAEGGLNTTSWSASRSRSRPGARYGAAGNQIEEILKYIEQHWAFMASADCIPVKVALQLMDPSSLGLQDQSRQFSEAHMQLQNALKVIVNEHHQGFNSSIGTFHKIQTAIQTSQARVRTLRAGLLDAKKDLVGGAQKPELKSLATSSQAYDQMLQTIATIEQLQLVPDRLEAQIREKRYLGAVDNLIGALTMIRKPELEDIGALSELKVHLSNQEQILTDLLVEELHNHLYLKSPYCEARWKAHVRRAEAASSTSAAIPAVIGLDDDRAIYTFLATFDGSKPMQEDASRNPEADTFYYIQLLIESLNKLSRLDLTADKIEERLPVELFKVLERTLSEVEQRHPQSLMKSGRRRQQLAAGGVIAGPDADQRATLEDLLTMLYAKFEAIAEGHRVLYDVTSSILKRDAVPSSDSATLNRSFRELWKLLQSEIRSLLHDHLASNGHFGTKSRQHNHASANLFKQHPRDRSRKLFKLQDTLKPGKDGRTNEDLTTEREDLEFILKASVPGLVSANSTSLRKTDPYSGDSNDISPGTDRSATGHKMLISPSIFNMGILLPPSLAFLGRLKAIVPPQSSSGVVPSTLTAFLDDFLINVFHPQLDETLLDLCGRCLGDLDTFQPDPHWAEVASRPIFRGTRRFYEILEGVCVLLDRLPHEQSFAQLVVAQMRAYYDRCYEWSKGLLQRVVAEATRNSTTPQDGEGTLKMRLAADLATEGDINAAVIALLTNPPDSPKDLTVLAEKESSLLLRLSKTTELTPADLIHSRPSLAALCTLHTSMKWLAARCKTLRHLSPHAVDTPNLQAGHTRRWTGGPNTTPPPSTPYLPLDNHTATQFDAVTTSFTELSTLLLRTLHIDIRLHLLLGIATALSSPHALGQPHHDPDPAILTLSEDLTAYTAALSTHLLPPQLTFLLRDLHILANNALVSLVSEIPDLDPHGLARIQLDVLVLQQTLKCLQPDPSTLSSTTDQPETAISLTKSSTFYALASSPAGPEHIVTQGPKCAENFAAEDLKALVRLAWDEGRDGEASEREAMAARLGGSLWPVRKASLKKKDGSGRGRGRGGG